MLECSSGLSLLRLPLKGMSLVPGRGRLACLRAEQWVGLGSSCFDFDLTLSNDLYIHNPDRSDV